MTMKKKILTTFSVVLILGMAALGILAYLTDSDSDVNVMTLGNVSIDQFEKERTFDTNGTVTGMQDFTPGQVLYPAVVTNGSGNAAWAPNSGVDLYYKDYLGEDYPGGNGTWQYLNNTIDKFVFVENTGKSDAYYRTIILFEADQTGFKNAAGQSLIHTNVNGHSNFTWSPDEGDINDQTLEVEVDGVKYSVMVATYNAKLTPGEISRPSLLQVGMDQMATNEHVAQFGNTYDILVLSQAVQAEGFADANTALKAGFGEVNATNVESWFSGMNIYDYSAKKADVVNGEVNVPKGEKRYLEGTQDPIKVTGEGTLYLRNVNIQADSGSAVEVTNNAKLVIEGKTNITGAIDGINVASGASLELSGKAGDLTAIGGNGVDTETGGSGIGGAGEIKIKGLKNLTAEGYGKAGFGIGGKTESITIEDTNIEYVKGGYVQPNFINDTSYGKSEPEGGAAIGSLVDGAVINLKNVVIEKAEGGSKAAGIGARYWTGVTINIEDCDIKEARGGNASAGIGGSRVAGETTSADAVTINIKDSKVTAFGGEFAAGIGSGYDTHCSSGQPVHTINITGDSVINATGGKYGAGIGTGYHVASLAGKIDSSVTVNATAGESREKYTKAMDVGFGVIDKSREGKDSPSSFDYKGTVITVSTAPDVN